MINLLYIVVPEFLGTIFNIDTHLKIRVVFEWIVNDKKK